jgi:tetratricopeptide (TPR) repeat protein
MPKYLLPMFVTFLLCPAAPGLSSNDPSCNQNQARAMIERGEYESGLAQLRSCHELFPLDQSVRRCLADGYHTVGLQLLRKKQYQQAGQLFTEGGELYPLDPRFMFLRGLCAYQLKQYDIARYELEQARLILPDDAELLHLLGRVLYDTDERDQALELWQRALELNPDQREVAALLERARREMAVEKLMARGYSSRFDLTYDKGVDTLFALAVLDELELAANLVGSELEHFSTARVQVTIYTKADYGTVTAAPEWSNGVYDGTIRLPFGSLRDLTPQLKAVLHHEYVHVVVYELTRGNCPLWLNEGVAEMFGRRQFAPPVPELELAARGVNIADIRRLERGFGSLATREAGLAYQRSWSLVNHLVTVYGWHRVAAILLALGQGVTIDEAIVRALADYGLTYEGLVREWNEAQDRGGKEGEQGGVQRVK